MESWPINDLRKYIERHYDNDVLLILNSLCRMVEIIRYHAFESQKVIDLVKKETTNQEIGSFDIIFGLHEQQKDFEEKKLIHEANLIACVHSIRNLYDIFSQLVNALILDSKIPSKKCSIYKVIEHLPNTELKTELENLINSYWFKFITVFSNSLKHRVLIRQGYSFSLEGNKFGLKIESFSFNGISYEPSWSSEVLEGIIEVKNLIVKCGNFISETVLGDELLDYE